MNTKDNLELLEAHINAQLMKLGAVTSGSEEHDLIVAKIRELTEIRNGYYSAVSGEVIPERRIAQLKPESIIGGLVSLTSLYLIMKFEKTDIIVTKGFSIVSKWIGR